MRELKVFAAGRRSQARAQGQFRRGGSGRTDFGSARPWARRRGGYGAADAACRRRLLGHLSRRDAGADFRAEARARRSSRSRPIGRRRSSATPTRSPGSRPPPAWFRRRCRRSSAHDRATASSRWPTSTRERIRSGRRSCRDGIVDAALRRRGRPPRRRDPRSDSRRQHGRGALRDRRASSAPIRLEPYLEASARRHPDVADRARCRWSRDTLAVKQALVHGDVSPEEHPGGAARPGLPRRRMRLVWRPRLRPRLLPQPPAAEMPVEPGGGAGLSWPPSTRSPPPIWRRSTWEPRAELEARAARAAAGPFPRPRRRQVAGRIHHRRCRPRPRPGDRAAA